MIKAEELKSVKAPKVLRDDGYLHFTYNKETYVADMTHSDGSVHPFDLGQVMSLIAFEHDNEQLDSRLKSVEHVQLDTSAINFDMTVDIGMVANQLLKS